MRSAPTEALTATPQVAAPDAVDSVSVTHSGESLSVSWDASARADRYDVEYKTSDAESWSSAASDHTGTTLTIGGVDAAKSYTVRVRAKNGGGESDWTSSDAAAP